LRTGLGHRNKRFSLHPIEKTSADGFENLLFHRLAPAESSEGVNLRHAVEGIVAAALGVVYAAAGLQQDEEFKPAE